MKKGTIKLSDKLLLHKLNIKPSIDLIGISYDPFDGTVTLLLHDDEMEDVAEGAKPIPLSDDEVVNPFSYHLNS